MKETSSSTTVSTKLQRIATLAQRMRDMPLTTLAHHIDLEWLREAFGARARTAQPAWMGRPRSSTRQT